MKRCKRPVLGIAPILALLLPALPSHGQSVVGEGTPEDWTSFPAAEFAMTGDTLMDDGAGSTEGLHGGGHDDDLHGGDHEDHGPDDDHDHFEPPPLYHHQEVYC